MAKLKEKLENTYYCLVVGSRGFEDYKKFCEVMDNYLKERIEQKLNIVIISGGARGADSLAKRYAKEHNYELEVVKAD